MRRHAPSMAPRADPALASIVSTDRRLLRATTCRVSGASGAGVSGMIRAVSWASPRPADAQDVMQAATSVLARDLFGCRENLRGVLQDVPGEASIDHSRVFDVIPSEDGSAYEKNEEDDTEKCEAERGSPESLLDADAQAFSIGLKFNCLLTACVWKAAVPVRRHPF